ncbi:hypothetical protein CJ179_50260 [Rhodococcus sp. ACS1]|uniref:hypothetical protein n=1 Tax=Rhodococcus sp. ACS1 TaxID=2028570 RepID=UPI000BB12D8C|nr:hypothetical protein [Rhodococcus sp. ACS1]PBC35024.1 hypothetical protein CJ179_50260 [Rhodococcus sp. ACS1]
MTTSSLLATKIWYIIQAAIGAMPTSEFVERIAYCVTHPEHIQPTWVIDRDTRTFTIMWAGSALFVGGPDILEWLCDDSSREMPDGGWVTPPPDNASELFDDDDGNA